MFKIAVLVSGGGTNLQAIIDAIKLQQITAEISLVVSSNAKAYALERAQVAKIKTVVITKHTLPSASMAILELMQKNKIDLIVLAGYLGILEGELLKVYHDRIINVHPALLPKFGGKGMYGHHVHEAVIKAREKFSGATVHYVTDRIDGGTIILQETIPVLFEDTATTLAKRVLKVEHQILPKAIQLIINQRR